MDGEMKTLELDKVCRVCLTTKKDMRPLFGEMVAEMLMEVARIQVNCHCYRATLVFCARTFSILLKFICLFSFHAVGSDGRMAR